MMTLRRGFTLLEILIVVGVLVVLSAFMTPTYDLLISQLQLNATVQQVAEEIRLAQQKTVTEQLIYGVTFTAGSTTIPLFRYNPANGAKTTISTYTLPNDVSINSVNFSNNNDIRFATSGAPNFSGNLVLRDTVRNRSRQIDIRPSGTVITNTPES